MDAIVLSYGSDTKVRFDAFTSVILNKSYVKSPSRSLPGELRIFKNVSKRIDMMFFLLAKEEHDVFNPCHLMA